MAHSLTDAAGNPFARRFSPAYSGKGGSWYVVEPESRMCRPWVRAAVATRSQA